MRDTLPKVLIAGLVGGFVGNGVLGAIFSSPPVQAILYNPDFQSALFIEITPKRDIPISVASLVVFLARCRAFLNNTAALSWRT